MDDDQLTVLALAGLWLYSRYSSGVVPALERGGAAAYEALHPEQRGHADDLPRPGRMTNATTKHPRMTLDALRDLAHRVGFPDPHLAAAVAMAESGGDPHAFARTSREQSVGLWQINMLSHPQWTRAQLEDPETNARAALHILTAVKSWKPWGAYTDGRYRRYL
jgi:hypothetical protein